MLLEDLFKLVSHRETREVPVYWLVVAEGGPKLGGRKEQEAFTAGFADKSPFQPGKAGLYSYKDLPELAEKLGGAPGLDRPVLDRTGIEGQHWFQLEWEAGPDTAGKEALLAALPEQLGLRLEEQTGAVEVVVIDRVERP